jgi:cysteine desulfurase
VLTYFDHAATTPLRPEVAAAMAQLHAQPLGNPTGSHPPAQRARRLLEDARDEVAACIGCAPGEVIFTSGGTESANLAVLGSLGACSPSGPRPLLLHSAVEHPAVLESCRAAAAAGAAELRSVPVDGSGRVDLAALAETLQARDTAVDVPRCLVAIMLANNETGVLQPLAEACDLVHQSAPGAAVFTDAVQAAAFVDLSAEVARADLIALSAHKLGGPVGTGVLVVRDPWILSPQLHGGGQERERRSGTQDVAGALGLALALRLASVERETEAARVGVLRDDFAAGLLERLDGVHRTVPVGVPALPGHLHLCLDGIDKEELLVALGERGICASGGSSCASGALQPSHVLSAMGIADRRAAGAVRFTLGRGTCPADVQRALSVVPEVVAGLRQGV